MEKSRSAFCKVCGQERRFVARKPNHALHIVLGIFTAGLWLLIYFLLVLRWQRFRCTVCGTTL